MANFLRVSLICGVGVAVLGVLAASPASAI